MSFEPHLPYLHVPDLVLLPKGALGNFPPAPFSLKPFGTLVAIGVYLGAWLAVKQARRLGLDERKLMSFIVWVVGVGFIGGHVLDTVFYFPERLVQDPLSLIRLWEGLSSFGGFVGAAIGLVLWRWRQGEDALPYADTVASAFPVGWVLGRSGCTLAHDHPGLMSDAWFAVRYPEGGRFDLGMYEMLLTIPLALAFLHLRKKPRPWGFYLAVMSIAYAPSRFALDFLRIREGATADARYLALTPAQWACFGLLAFGVALLWRTLDKQDFSIPVPPPEPAPADG